jgi:predicted RNA-binding Zn-ribbon protein involved in translation (DUF1610 family)
MWWDDLELLRMIDLYEQKSNAYLSDGFKLMEQIAHEKSSELDWKKDIGPFAHELRIARDAGYLVFDDRAWPGQPMPPESDAHMWLQRIRDIRLTLHGRDRARRRLLILPPPDPDEDDGRPIAQLTLAEIAEAIASTYSDKQLLMFLTASGIPDSILPKAVGNRGDYVLAVLLGLHDGGADTRRTLRTFIGNWLSDRLLTGPSPEVRERVNAQLDRQGWHVQEGRLMIGAVATGQEQAATTGPEQGQICLSGHPINWRVRGQPEVSKPFCPKCGKQTITNCPNCRKEIPGDFVVWGYCQYCGNPYPWTDKSQTAGQSG